MAEQKFLIEDMKLVLKERSFPSVTLWNRLDGRPRTHHFDRALRAEVRDPLWMLSRQWQLGEFEGDDAGSPVLAKLHVAQTQLTKYQPREGEVEPFASTIPLEARVEQLPLPLEAGGQALGLDIRLLVGRHWLKLLTMAGFGAYAAGFVKAFGVAPATPDTRQGAPVCAHAESWQHIAAVAGRKMDGYQWLEYLSDHPIPRTYADLAPALAIDPGDIGDIDTLAQRLQDWFAQLFQQPAQITQQAWKPDQLEYQFNCAAPQGAGEQVFRADEYYHGRLDWYNFDLDAPTATLGEAPADPAPSVQSTLTQTFMPTPLEFAGMPNTRWWTFEDGRTNFAGIKPDTTDLGKLLLMEFGLVYANDWFLVPLTLPAGTVAQVRGLAVTNVFGERTWITAASGGFGTGRRHWGMYTLSSRTENPRLPADTRLLLLPTVPKIQEGTPLEEVMLVRDEMANMVWAIEKTIPLPTGVGKPGSEAARETRQYFEALLASQFTAGALTPEAIAYQAPIRYEVMNTVPENWIPFIPVRVPGSNRQIQLQRASMPRILDEDPEKPRKVKPRTTLLRVGLEETPAVPFFVPEEEAPQAGVRVSLAYQRTRWYGGKVVTWLGARKQTGRGGGSSGLAYDRVLPVKKAAE
ncbi:MAG: hypothetical protein H6555_08980 [Lewinellaceae bacterium]|nr:hypothetical protein [Lewinellaceae bacterium]